MYNVLEGRDVVSIITVGTPLRDEEARDHVMDYFDRLIKKGKRSGVYHSVKTREGAFIVRHTLTEEEQYEAAGKCIWEGHQYNSNGVCLKCHHREE
jgi:hypothetical protein